MQLLHLPPSAKENLSGKNRYPVIYLLDGDWNLTGVAGMDDFLSSLNGNSFWPEMIVVGILNTDRTRYLTPTRVTCYMKSLAIKESSETRKKLEGMGGK